MLKRDLTPPEQHQLRVALQTLKLPEALVPLMGGPITKQEAREIVDRLTRRQERK